MSSSSIVSVPNSMIPNMLEEFPVDIPTPDSVSSPSKKREIGQVETSETNDGADSSDLKRSKHADAEDSGRTFFICTQLNFSFLFVCVRRI